MTSIPTRLERTSQGLRITWSDGRDTEYGAQRLRDACPCATCREKKRESAEDKQNAPLALPVLSPAEAQPLSIEKMRPVGNYAYNISFSDGHDSGIYTFDHLLELGSTAPAESDIPRG